MHADFERVAARGYLDTATVGLPPRQAWDAIQAHLGAWRAGRLDPAACDADVARARALFARIVGVSSADVAIGSHLSVFAGLVAASLEPGAQVLVAREDFTSVLFPFLAQEARGVRVRVVPITRIVEAIDARVALVAVSSVQSADGARVDLDALAAAADHHAADVFLDVTQHAGAAPADGSRFAYVAAAAYKWLLCPRGTAFLAVRRDAAERLIPNHANWYAGPDPWACVYGPPLRLADGARRLDVSPAWACWAAAAPALEVLIERGLVNIAEHDMRLAYRLCGELGLEPPASPIVSVPIDGAVRRLAGADVRASVRAGCVRLSFHLYNDDSDVDTALEALSDLRLAV